MYQDPRRGICKVKSSEGKDENGKWLDPDNQNTGGLKDLFKPFPDDEIDYFQVSKEVNSVKNNSE